MHTLPLTTNEADEIARAEQVVAERKAQLSRSVRRASQSGEDLAKRLSDEVKPALAVAIAAASVVVVVGLGIAVSKVARRRRGWLAPREPSQLNVAAKAAGVWALRMLARRVAQEVVARFAEPSVATAPNQVER
jgi:DNA-binding phage protein